MCFFVFLFTLQTRNDLHFFPNPIKTLNADKRFLVWSQIEGNVYHGISQLIQYFPNELYSQLVSFSWKYIFSILFVLVHPLDLLVHLDSLYDKKQLKNSNGWQSQTTDSLGSIITRVSFFFSSKDEMQNGSFVKQNITLALQKCVVLESLKYFGEFKRK